MAVKITCTTCGHTTTSRTRPLAEYGQARHSCTKRLTADAARAATIRRYQQTAIERPCTHKTHHEHGTNARAALDGCKCDPCRDAAYKATKQWRTRVATHGHVYVDTAPAVAHLKQLQAAGLGWKRVAALAGLNSSVVYPLLYGRPDRNGGKPRTKARRATIDKILAVPLPSIEQLGSVVAVPAIGTRRRLQALATLGWSMTALADRAGLADRQPLDRALTQDTTSAGTARAIVAIYDQLWNQPPPPATTPGAKAAISRVRNHATRQGWAPPLAWDEESIDDPTAQPATNEAPRTTGGRPGVDLDEFMWLIHTGEHPERAATRLDTTLGTIASAARRTGRHDVLPHTTARAIRGQECATCGHARTCLACTNTTSQTRPRQHRTSTPKETAA